MVCVDNNVPLSSQWQFVLGNDVAAESWGIHPNKNVYASKWSNTDFDLGILIGQGGFGRVVHARFRRDKITTYSEYVRNRDVALKIISKEAVIEREKLGRRAVTLLRRETNIHSHPTSFTFVMEFAVHGDVLSYFNQMKKQGRSPDRALIRQILLQTCRAIAYLEQSQVAHRDIKPENIVVTENLEAKLTDFGWAIRMHSSPRQWQTTFCGTAEYCPPEMATRENLRYDPRFVDRWMLGVLIVELFSGSTPFHPQVDDDDVAEYNRMALEMVKSFYSVNQLKLPRDVKELVSKLLVVEPHNRKSAEWVLVHPFFGRNAIPPEASPTLAQSHQMPQNKYSLV